MSYATWATGLKQDFSRRLKLALLTVERASSLWPTPTATDAKASGAAGYSTESGRHAGVTLTDAAVRVPRLWSTPRADMYKLHPSCFDRADRAKSNIEEDAGTWLRSRGLLSATTKLGGRRTSKSIRVLNPRFVQSLMGLPPGWSDFDSSEMELSRNKPPARFANSTAA